MKRKILFLTATMGLMSVAQSFAQLTLSGEFRPRTELRNGFKKPTLNTDNFALFTEQRSRLTLDYKSEKFNTKITLQDVRIWGEVGQINKTDGLMSIHEAYADYNFSANSYLRFGRQELVYDDHRVLGSLNWAAQARSHDALRYVKKDSTWELHGVLTWNQDNSPAEPAKLQGTNANAFTTYQGAYTNPNTNTIFQLSNPKSTQFLWFKKTFSAGNVTFLALNDVVQTTDSSSHGRQLFGINPTIKAGDLKFFGSFYYQMGKQNDTVDYGSMLASLQATYLGIDKVKPTLGFDYLSGDDASTTDKVETFNPLYGTHHKFYGLMDYFYVGNGHSNKGLLDVYLKLALNVGDKSKLLIHGHQFMAVADITDPVVGGNMSSNLGTEIDLVYVSKLADGVTLKAGYSQMFATNSLSAIKGYASTDITTYSPDVSGFNSWAWVMIGVNPTFLKK